MNFQSSGILVVFVLLGVAGCGADNPYGEVPQNDSKTIAAIEGYGGEFDKKGTGVVLANTRITDAGLEHLKELQGLEVVDLSGTPITDEGLKHLKEIPTLKFVMLTNTRVSPTGVNELKSALPECTVSVE